MLKTIHKYFIPACLAVLVHVVLFSLFFLNFKSDPKPPKPAPQPEIIQATSLDETKVIQEIKNSSNVRLTNVLLSRNVSVNWNKNVLPSSKNSNNWSSNRNNRLNR